MAKPILVANWKNYPKSLSEASSLLNNISRDRDLYKKLSFYIAPPLPYLEKVSSRSGSFMQAGVQDISPVSLGTHTGQVSPDILKSFGVRLAILGHSERRALGETSYEVAKKAKIALKSGITPLVCIGEKVRDEDGGHFEFIEEEIKFSLTGITKNEAPNVLIAYEPIWAIGKSARDAMEGSELSQTILFIKKILSDMFGRRTAEKMNILYGGSVEPANAPALLDSGSIRGFLVGHASLNAKSLKEIATILT
jgi:triosephosphate isomerase